MTALLAAGADFNQAAENGWCPLHVASSRGKVECVTALLHAGAGANQASSEGLTLNLSTAERRNRCHKERDTSFAGHPRAEQIDAFYVEIVCVDIPSQA